MKLRLRIALVTVSSLLTIGLSAQQAPMYSQYLMNGFLINPSVAGIDGFSTVNLTMREQWVGFQGAPHTYAASFQTRLLKNSYISRSTSVKKKGIKPTKGGNVGVGGYVFNDRNGIISRTGILGAYAYHIQLKQRGQYPDYLSLGIAATIYQYAVDLDGNLMLQDDDDDFLNNYDRVVFVPDFNFGATYTSDKFYVGFAMTSLSRGSVLIANKSDNYRTELGHYYITGGMKIPLPNSSDLKLEPSVLFKSSDMLFKSFQMDLTTRVYYKEYYWAGLSWRTNDAVIALFGLKYDKFYFAYAFDFLTNDIRKHSLGTHELTLAAKFGESARRYRWINQR
jgi:type IX secretion system PorP/SprF family membrane protein